MQEDIQEDMQEHDNTESPTHTLSETTIVEDITTIVTPTEVTVEHPSSSLDIIIVEDPTLCTAAGSTADQSEVSADPSTSMSSETPIVVDTI